MSDTPYMKMKLPVPGTTPAGQWGGQLNEALRDHVDSHDHVPGRGKPVPSDGIKIDKDLQFRGNSATNAKSVGLVSQQTKIGTPGHVHVVDGDLYFTDGHGRHVRLTENGQVVPGLEGNIQGLVHPAEARYSGVEQKFTFTQNVNTGIRAMLDVGGLMIRAMAAGAKRILLKAPEIVDEYDLTLPDALPESNLPVFLDEKGQLSTTGQLQTAQIADKAVTTAKIDDGAVTTAKLDDGAVTTDKIGAGAITKATLPAAVAYKDATNIFSDQQRFTNTTAPMFAPVQAVSVGSGPAVAAIAAGDGDGIRASSAEGFGGVFSTDEDTKGQIRLVPIRQDSNPDPTPPMEGAVRVLYTHKPTGFSLGLFQVYIAGGWRTVVEAEDTP